MIVVIIHRFARSLLFSSIFFIFILSPTQVWQTTKPPRHIHVYKIYVFVRNNWMIYDMVFFLFLLFRTLHPQYAGIDTHFHDTHQIAQDHMSIVKWMQIFFSFTIHPLQLGCEYASEEVWEKVFSFFLLLQFRSFFQLHNELPNRTCQGIQCSWIMIIC